MMNNFIVDFDQTSLSSFFELSFKSLQAGQIEFCFELLSRLLVSKEGLDLFCRRPQFLAQIKRVLGEGANQETKKKVLGLIELALCSKKICLETQIISDHFASATFLNLLYFFFFNSLENQIFFGRKGLGG